MNQILKVSAMALTASMMLSACGSKKENTNQEVKLETLDQRLSYAIGNDVGTNLKAQGINLDPNIVAQGIMDAYSDSGTAKMTSEEINKTFMEFQEQTFKKQQESMAGETAKYEAEAQQYMAELVKKPGVTQTPSGLIYEVLKPGTGATPTASSVVKVHYHGTLLDGTVFDSSVDRGEPAEFPLNGVIQGWTEGLQLMKVGAKHRLTIPASLAYGNTPPPGSPIKAGMALIFEVELLEIVQ